MMWYILSAVLALVVILAGVALVLRRSDRQPQQQAVQVTARCSACGRKFRTQSDAVEHLRDVHNAPGDELDVKELVETPSE